MDGSGTYDSKVECENRCGLYNCVPTASGGMCMLAADGHYTYENCERLRRSPVQACHDPSWDDRYECVPTENGEGECMLGTAGNLFKDQCEHARAKNHCLIPFPPSAT